MLAALIGNALIAVTKFAAAAYTGSSAMLSEAIHSVVDTGNQVLLLYGMRRAARPADRLHPFGYGMEVYFWSFVVAILIFAVGAGVSIYEGIAKLIEPHPIRSPHVNYIVLGIAFVFEAVAWTVAFKAFRRSKGSRGYIEEIRRSKDPTIFTVLFEDSAAALGLVTAFIGIALGQWLGQPWLDGAASVVIGIILFGTAAVLAYECKGLLIGESASQRVVDGIRELIAAEPAVVHVNELRTMHMGPNDILLAVSLDFDHQINVVALEAAISGLERAIKQRFPEIKRVFIEVQGRAQHDADAAAAAPS